MVAPSLAIYRTLAEIQDKAAVLRYHALQSLKFLILFF